MCRKIHELIHRLHNPDASALLLRLGLGAVFINSGWMKVTNMSMVVGGFDSMGIPAFLAYFVSYAELIGGLLLIIGIFVRYAGIVLAVIMLVACKILFAKGFSLANGGYEYTFMLTLASAAIVTLGAGKYSLADLLKKKNPPAAPTV